MTEIVRCRSQKEVGVSEALGECSSRYLTATISLSPARIVVVLGANASKAFRRLFVLDGNDPVIGPVVRGGAARMVAFLPHPNARRKRTFSATVGTEQLQKLREYLRL
jgi:uracil-DNA glycosylase